MSYLEFPTVVYQKDDLANVAQTVGTDARDVHVTWMYLEGGAAAREVILQDGASSPVEHFRLRIGANENKSIDFGGFGFRFVGGLEVLTDSATADVGVKIAYKTT